jgi:oligopeptide transport system ATP-binding protein
MTTAPILETRDLTRIYGDRSGFFETLAGKRTPALRAVDGITMSIPRGAVLGIVGESGCGKSTLARCLVGLDAPDAGEVVLAGQVLGPRRTLAERRRMQIVFQDPYSSLNPRMTVGAALAEAVSVHRVRPRAEIPGRVRELLDMVGLRPTVASAYPRQLSGGQRQRVGIARALAPEPEVLVADEPVSALDVSVQATVLNLISDLRRQLGLTVILISHALGVVEYLCDRIAVMYLGRIVEEGPATDVFAAPRHPYTRALLAAAPKLGETLRDTPPASVGEPASPFDLPSGCRYRTRCPAAADPCLALEPMLSSARPGAEAHRAACHFAWTGADVAGPRSAPRNNLEGV